MDASILGAPPVGLPQKRVLLAGLAAAAIALLGAADRPPSQVGGEVVPPRKISGELPVYTEEARLAGVEGSVNIEAVIDEGGDVTGARIVQGLRTDLDRAALDAFATWKFDPATRRGTPVRAKFVLTVNFRFDNDFDFGPVFALFLRQNPDLAALYRRGRYAEALDLLDHWPDPKEPLLPLARAYVSLGDKDPRGAWEWVKADPAPPPLEVLLNVGGLAARSAVNDASLSAAQRADYVEVALEAATLAVESAERDPSALIAKSRALRLKIWLTADAAQKEALFAEVQRLEARAEAAGGTPP